MLNTKKTREKNLTVVRNRTYDLLLG